MADLLNPKAFEIKDTLWKVVKFEKDKHAEVNLGSVIRFGRMCFKVTEIKIPATVN